MAVRTSDMNSAPFASLKNYDFQRHRLLADGGDKTSDVEVKKLRTVDQGRYRIKHM